MGLVQGLTGTEIRYFPKSGFEEHLSKNMGLTPLHFFKYFFQILSTVICIGRNCINVF